MSERRRGPRRHEDRTQLAGARTRTSVATVGAVCGGLAVLYFFFAAIGAVDLGDAIVATLIAAALGLVWLAFFLYRVRTDATRTQRPDRERRGF